MVSTDSSWEREETYLQWLTTSGVSVLTSFSRHTGQLGSSVSPLLASDPPSELFLVSTLLAKTS